MIKLYSLLKDGNRQLSPHFKVREFAPKWHGKPDGDLVKIDETLILLLEKLSDRVKNSPISINDGYRTEKFDRYLTGKAGQHTTGKAADIQCSGFTSYQLAELAEGIGFNGIGIINERAIHVDTRAVKCFFIENGTKAGREKIVSTFVTKKGKWMKNTIGWWYENADGSYPKAAFQVIDGRSYYFDGSGYAVKGCREVGGKLYWFADRSQGMVKECQLIKTDGFGVVI